MRVTACLVAVLALMAAPGSGEVARNLKFKLQSPSMKPEELRINKVWADLSGIKPEDFDSTMVAYSSYHNMLETPIDQYVQEFQREWTFHEKTTWDARLGLGDAGSSEIDLPVDSGLLPGSLSVSADFREGVSSPTKMFRKNLTEVIITPIPAMTVCHMKFLVHSSQETVPIEANFTRKVWDVYTGKEITSTLKATGRWVGTLVSGTQVLTSFEKIHAGKKPLGTTTEVAEQAEQAEQDEEDEDHPSWHHHLAHLITNMVHNYEDDNGRWVRQNPLVDVATRGLKVFVDY